MSDIEHIIADHFKDYPEPNLAVKVNHFVKRTFDIVGSSIGLIVGSPIIGVLALATLYDSGSPAFFKQSRIGYRGEIITISKIRTMHNGSDERFINGEINIKTKYGDVPYTSDVFTKYGKFFDYIHVNELPQLWNVLKGDMSLVGNRPIQISIAESLIGEKDFIERFNSKPGLFGYTQLYPRGEKNDVETSNLEKEYSRVYNSKNCFVEDLKILYNTFEMYKNILFKKKNYYAVINEDVLS